MWVELPEGVDVAELEKAAAEREVLFVKGTDFLLEGGQNTLRLAYSGVTPGADRRGHHQARRGAPLPWRRSVIATATTPRSTACCTARGRSRCSSTAGSGGTEYDLTLMDAAGRGPRRARLGGVEHRVPAARQRRRRAGRRSTTSSAAIDHLAELPAWTARAWWRSATAPAATSRRGRRPARHPRVAVTGVVSQAGVLDLQRAARAAAVRRRRRPLPRRAIRRSVASPIERLPLGVPALLTHGGLDDIVPVEISAALRRAPAARR